MIFIKPSLLLLAFLISSCFVNGQNTFEGDKFRIDFPGEPSTWAEVYEDSAQPYTINFYLYEKPDGSVLFLLSSTDFEISYYQTFSENEIDEILYTTIYTFLESLDMEPTYTEELTLQENLGVMFSGTSNYDYCQGMVFMVENRIYQIVAITSDSNFDKQVIDNFLYSFSLK